MLTSSVRLDLSSTEVLVVDDNSHSLELMTQVLLGFRVQRLASTRCSAEARDLLANQAFDLVIVDAELGDEDGIELAHHIRGRPDQPNFTAPILVASAHTPLHKVNRARDAGANLVIKKPIVPATLLERIVWLAKTERQFVNSPEYCGPDRRFRRSPPPDETGERRADALSLTRDPDRALSQDDIDALF